MTEGWTTAWRLLVPEADQRTPITLENSPILLIPVLFLAIHVYLNIHSAPSIAHLSILPVTLLATLHIHASFVFTYARANVYNQILGVAGCVVAIKAVEWSFVPVRRRDGRPPPTTPLEEVQAITDVICDTRGVRYTFGERCNIKPVRDPRLVPFVKSKATSFILHFLLVDTLKTLVRFFGPIGTSSGGSMFMDSIPLPWRYALSTFLTLCIGSAIYAFIQAIHDLASIVAVLALRNDPSSWPALFNHPWEAQSVADFWANRWHQLFRRAFIVCSSPGRWLAGNVGAVIFAFLASGIMHEIGFRCMGKGTATERCVGFFLLQALACIIEVTLLKRTGVEVKGTVGRLWTFAWVLGGGNLIAEAWAVRGTAGNAFFPPSLSIVDRIQQWVAPSSPYCVGH